MFGFKFDDKKQKDFNNNDDSLNKDACPKESAGLDEKAADFSHQIEDPSVIEARDAKEKADEKNKGYWEAQFLRISADFQNYVRRVEKEKYDYIKISKIEIIKAILPVFDEIDLALKSTQKLDLNGSMKEWFLGLEMTKKNLSKRLADLNILEISCNGLFDPNFHEALMQVDSADHKSGEIVEIFLPGFTYLDQVIRHAKVSVAK